MIILGIIGIIAAGVAAGILLAKAVMFTINFIRNKIKEKLAKRNTQKVAVGEMNSLIEEAIKNCSNETSLEALDEIVDNGATHYMADVDSNGKVTDVEIFEDINTVADKNVERLIDRTGEGMVVISA